MSKLRFVVKQTIGHGRDKLLFAIVSLMIVGGMFVGQAQAATYNCRLVAGQVMYPGDVTTSCGGGAFELVFQTDSNVVLYEFYNNRTARRPIWATNTSGQGAQRLVMQQAGNLVLYNAASQAIWFSDTGRYTSPNDDIYLEVSADGQLRTGDVNYSSYPYPYFWQTNNRICRTQCGYLFAGETIRSNENRVVYSPNGRYRFEFGGWTRQWLRIYRDNQEIWSDLIPGVNNIAMQGDGNLVVSNSFEPVWDTRTAGRPGAYFVMQDDGNAVVYAPKAGGGWQAVWSSRTAGK